ncbi:MAG: hypothetical protein AB9917_01990 [Negativicutes bacterium]
MNNIKKSVTQSATEMAPKEVNDFDFIQCDSCHVVSVPDDGNCPNCGAAFKS